MRVVALVRDVERRQHEVGLLLGDAARLDVRRQRDDLAAVAERLERRRGVLGQRHDLRRLRRQRHEGARRVLHLHRVPVGPLGHRLGAPAARREHRDGQQEEQGWPRHGAYYMKRFPRLTHRAQSTRRPQTACSRPPRRTRPCRRSAPRSPTLRRAIAEVRASAPAVEAFAARAAATGGTQPSADERVARDRFRAGRGGRRHRARAAARDRRAGQGRRPRPRRLPVAAGRRGRASSAGSTASPRWRTGTTSARASPAASRWVGRRPRTSRAPAAVGNGERAANERTTRRPPEILPCSTSTTTTTS